MQVADTVCAVGKAHQARFLHGGFEVSSLMLIRLGLLQGTDRDPKRTYSMVCFPRLQFAGINRLSYSAGLRGKLVF